MPNLAPIRLSYAMHRQQAVVRIDFAYNSELAALVKTIAGTVWSQMMNAWYIDKKQFQLNMFFEVFRGKAWVDYKALKGNSPVDPAPSTPQKNRKQLQPEID